MSSSSSSSSAGGLRRRRVGGEEESAPPRSPRITLESFDLRDKVRGEEAVASSSGGGVSLAAVLLCALLVLAEVWSYAAPPSREHMAVDPSDLGSRLRINFDVSFWALPCAEANIDAMDVAGEQQNGLEHEITKTRLSSGGAVIGSAYAHRIEAQRAAAAARAAAPPLPPDYCGSCYGAGATPEACCNTCDAVRAAYGEKGWDVAAVTASAEQCAREARNVPAVESAPGEGCRLAGSMTVNKVAGNFHVAIGETHTRGAGHIHQFNPANIPRYNASHTIHALSFGEPFPGMRNPLDGTRHTVTEGSGVFMYYIKVVPTVYDEGGAIAAAFSLQAGQAGGSQSRASAPGGAIARAAAAHARTLKTNQFSVTTQYRPSAAAGHRLSVIPGVFFVYDVSPFMVTVTRHGGSLVQLITSIFAILGGVLTLAKAVDWLARLAQETPAVRQLVAGAAAAAVSARSPGGGGAGGGGGKGGGTSPPATAPAAASSLEPAPAAAYFGAAGGDAAGAQQQRRGGDAAGTPPLTPPYAPPLQPQQQGPPPGAWAAPPQGSPKTHAS